MLITCVSRGFRRKLSISFSPKDRLDERIRNDHAHPASVFLGGIITADGQVEKSLSEWNTQLILPVARGEPRAVSFPEYRVAYVDIRRVANDHVVRLTENPLQFVRVLCLVEIMETILEQSTLNPAASEAGTMQEGVSGSEIESEMGASFSRLMPLDSSAAINSRKREISTANGLRSTP